jgi:hypothetical protein
VKKSYIRLALLAAVLVLAFGGCSLFPVSIEERIQLFMDDLNKTDRSMIYLNFHPTLTTDYDAIQGGTHLPDWDVPFAVAYISYSIADLDPSNPSTVTGNINTAYGAWAGPKAVVFRMAQDGANWMIQGMDFHTWVPLIQ